LVKIKRISFKYPDQTKYPPKKKQMFFDCEAFFFYNDSLYLFTKSGVKKEFGKTSLYKLPAKQGLHNAIFIGTFNTCSKHNCRITSADISKNGKKVALLSHNSVWLFSDFKGDDFFNGIVQKFPLNHSSQKEGITFKSNNSFYITDERGNGKGGNLYEFKLD